MTSTQTTSFLGIAHSELAIFEAALASAVAFTDNCPAKLGEAIRYVLLAPGKRLRPQLAMLACQACGGAVDAALPFAVAIEMIHAYSLVHDDLPAMDDDDLRRGRATCHKQFSEATAILVGDALQARAFEVLATQASPPGKAARACAILAAAAGAEALVGGQADDLAAETSPVDVEQLKLIHARKTGALFRASLQLGALAADASETELAILDAYGQRLGLAFQIGDDLLDVDGAEAKVGKRLSKDQEKGKTTYPSLLGVETSRGYAAELIEQACSIVSELGEAAKPLAELAQFVGKRNH